MKTTKKKLGFTLIELLAVIVILGVIMMIAIPSVTNYITGARADSFVDTSKELIQAVRNYAITENLLPQYQGDGVLFPLKDQSLEKGGGKSPFGKEWDSNYWYVIIAAGKINDTTQAPNYYYFFGGNDAAGNLMPLTEESAITKKLVGNAGSKTAGEARMDADILRYMSPATGTNTTPVESNKCTLASGSTDKCESNTAGVGGISSISGHLSANSNDSAFDNDRYVEFAFSAKSASPSGTAINQIGNYDATSKTIKVHLVAGE